MNVNSKLNDLSDFSDEDIVKFKELFNATRVSPVHKDAGKNFDNLLEFAVDILAKRVPVENVNVKID